MFTVTVHWLSGRKAETFHSTEMPEVSATTIKLIEDAPTIEGPHERYLVLTAMRMFELSASGD